jgi:hypothetical protein
MELASDGAPGVVSDGANDKAARLSSYGTTVGQQWSCWVFCDGVSGVVFEEAVRVLNDGAAGLRDEAPVQQ